MEKKGIIGASCKMSNTNNTNNINNIIKENHDLKNELESMVIRIKENEAKHNAFKVVQFAMLLSNNLEEVNNKPLKYIEDIFEIDRAVLFIKKDTFTLIETNTNKNYRIMVPDDTAFSYTFLENNIRLGSDKSIIHKDFQIMPSNMNYSYAIIPIIDNNSIVAALGFYSSNKNKFSPDNNYDFIEELAVIAYITLKKLENEYLLTIKGMENDNK